MIYDEGDEYETQAEADARQLFNAAGQVVVTLPADEPSETIVEYGVFNDPEFWDPLFETEIDRSLYAQQILEPMHSTLSLRSAVRFADLRNTERAEQGKMDKYGPVVVRTRTITRAPWRDVAYDEIDAIRRR